MAPFASSSSKFLGEPQLRFIAESPPSCSDRILITLHRHHSSRKKPLLPVIRMGDGALRYRASGIEAFIDERERMGAMRRRAG